MTYTVVKVSESPQDQYTDLCKKYTRGTNYADIEYDVTIDGLYETNFTYNSNGIHTPVLTNMGVVITYIENKEFHIYNILNKKSTTHFEDITDRDSFQPNFSTTSTYIRIENGKPVFTKIETNSATTTYLVPSSYLTISQYNGEYSVNITLDGLLEINSDADVLLTLPYSHYIKLIDTNNGNVVVPKSISSVMVSDDNVDFVDLSFEVDSEYNIIKILDRKYSENSYLLLTFDESLTTIMEVW